MNKIGKKEIILSMNTNKNLSFTNFLIQKQKASFILDKLNILFSLKFVLFIIIIIFTEIQKKTEVSDLSICFILF